MDLLFKRYASPFLLLDEVIKTCRFSEFISRFVVILNEESEKESEEILWEYYLHRVFDKSFSNFKQEMQQPKQPEENVDFGTTLKMSYDILSGFIPN